MARFNHPLNHVKIASPCSVDWEDMIGNDRRRFCGQCELNVFNLSDMTQREAEALINQAEGRLCVRFFRRADGSILTKNCPVGLRAASQRLSRIATATLSAVVAFVAGTGLYGLAQALNGITKGRVMERQNVMGVMAQPQSYTPKVSSNFSQIHSGRENGMYEGGKLSIVGPRSVNARSKR